MAGIFKGITVFSIAEEIEAAYNDDVAGTQAAVGVFARFQERRVRHTLIKARPLRQVRKSAVLHFHIVYGVNEVQNLKIQADSAVSREIADHFFSFFPCDAGNMGVEAQLDHVLAYFKIFCYCAEQKIIFQIQGAQRFWMFFRG